jgi:hypothetical protein
MPPLNTTEAHIEHLYRRIEALEEALELLKAYAQAPTKRGPGRPRKTDTAGAVPADEAAGVGEGRG